MGITDEMLMAYADGELDAEAAARVEAAMATDDSLGARMARMAEARAAVRRAYQVAPPVPAALEARVREMIAAKVAADRQAQAAPPAASNVVDLASRRRVVPFWQLPAAAMLALAVGAGSAWLAAPEGGGAAGLQMAGLEDPGLRAALASLPSGETARLEGGGRFVAIASFRDSEDRLCREFEHDQADGRTLVAVACRDAADWDLRFAIAAAGVDPEGYAPASSLEALDAYLTATGAGAPLSAADEAAALQALD